MPYAPLLSDEELAAALAELAEWRREGQTLVRAVRCASFRRAIELVDAVADAAEAADHHPDIEIVWRRVTFRLTSKASGGLTAKDVDMARAIEHLADVAADEAAREPAGESLSDAEIARRLEEAPGWTRNGPSISRELEAGSFEKAIHLLSTISDAVARSRADPSVTLRGRTLQLRLTHLSHSGSGLTTSELDLAAEIDRLFAAAAAT